MSIVSSIGEYAGIIKNSRTCPESVVYSRYSESAAFAAFNAALADAFVSFTTAFFAERAACFSFLLRCFKVEVNAACFFAFSSNFSTRRAVSTSFCLPVKNGWHFEQISTAIASFVESDSNPFPQAQVMVMRWLVG